MHHPAIQSGPADCLATVPALTSFRRTGDDFFFPWQVGGQLLPPRMRFAVTTLTALVSRYFRRGAALVQRFPARFGRHLIQRYAWFLVQQQQLQARQILAARTESCDARLPQLLIQRLNLKMPPTEIPQK